jgi:DNA polymerase I-like protein with 3'-5' exonuclease and polymerase domains
MGLSKRLPYYSTDPARAHRDAEVYLKKFFETYAGIPKFRIWLAKQMRANGNMFISPFGRPRRIPTVASSDESERARAERMMMSSIVSGTAADMMKIILLRCGDLIAANDWNVEIKQSIHDEIVFDLPIEGCGEIIPQLFGCFTDWPQFERGGVPIRATCELSTTTWEDKRSVEILTSGGFRWAA